MPISLVGRPSNYEEDTGAEICRRISNGESLREICNDGDMPELVTVFNWITLHDQFAKRYARARDVQADVLADEIIYLSNTCRKGTIITEKLGPEQPDGSQVLIERKVVTEDMIERTRLQIDARKWWAARVAPLKYGDRIHQQLLDEKGKPAKLEITVSMREPTASST